MSAAMPKSTSALSSSIENTLVDAKAGICGGCLVVRLVSQLSKYEPRQTCSSFTVDQFSKFKFKVTDLAFIFGEYMQIESCLEEDLRVECEVSMIRGFAGALARHILAPCTDVEFSPSHNRKLEIFNPQL